MQKTSPEYLRTPEAAEYLGLSRQYLEIARHRGVGPAFCKLGRAVRYRKIALDEWAQRHECNRVA
jgi:excisionase family DNA binding protein